MNPATLAEAQHLQGIVARADRTVALAGIAGTKYLLHKLYGYGGFPRRPLRAFEREEGEKLYSHPHVVALIGAEKMLVERHMQ